MKRYGIPLLTLAVGYLVYYLVRTYVTADFQNQLLTLIVAGALFAFGASMSTYSRKSSTWVKKTAIIAAVVFMICLQLNVVKVPEILSIINRISVNSFLFEMLYVYFGFIFF